MSNAAIYSFITREKSELMTLDRSADMSYEVMLDALLVAIEHIKQINLSGAENFLESQDEKTVTRENAILVSNCDRLFKDAAAGGLYSWGIDIGRIAFCMET